jgi:hypothetical protein
MILPFSNKRGIKEFGGSPSETSTRTGQRLIAVGSIAASLTVRCTPTAKVFMSLQLMSAVWRLEIPSHEKFVLLALADHAKDDGACWPGIPLLAKKCSLSERQIQRVLKRLENRGFINRKMRHGRSTHYQVMVTGMSPSAKEGVTLMSPSPVKNVTTDGDAHVTQNRNIEPPRIPPQALALEERGAMATESTEELIAKVKDQSLAAVLERMKASMQRAI